MADYPEVEEATRFIQSGRHLYGYKDKEFFEEEISIADSNIFRVFDYEWIEGDPETALKEPNSIVLTRSFAERYFGSGSPIGKELTREDDRSFNVTGLIEDLPHNTNYTFSALLSRNTIPEDYGSWELYTNHMAEIFERMGI